VFTCCVAVPAVDAEDRLGHSRASLFPENIASRCQVSKVPVDVFVFSPAVHAPQCGRLSFPDPKPSDL